MLWARLWKVWVLLGRARRRGLEGRGRVKIAWLMCECFTDVDKGRKLMSSTGIPLSTYFSAIKLRWMIDHHPEVHQAHEEDDLMFGTVDTWLVYVSSNLPFVVSKLTSSL